MGAQHIKSSIDLSLLGEVLEAQLALVTFRPALAP
jgi:hypothetical protein